jgi:hypothetical protein
MVINVDKDNKPLELMNHIVSGKDAEAVYRLIGKLNGECEHDTDEDVREP